jgi:tetratricopeptide (TPR) repeat protein/transcriptional regulator with XRE-family HTH domain
VTQSGGGGAATELGLALYQLRLARGLSLRTLARRLGMAGHGGLLEYERGRRLPPEDVILAYERVLGVEDGRLVRLRERALVERAAAKTAERVRHEIPGERPKPPATVPSRPGAGAPPPPPGRVPAQLPVDVPDFTGRDQEVAELLASDEPSIAVISGNPGIGKTTLAVHVAHRLAAEYPDAQLYCDLHGVREPMDPAEALAAAIRVLGVPDSQLPVGLAERAGLYRSLLHGRRCVVVLDNAADEAQVRPLLPGGAHCRVLVTSRSRLSGLAGVHRLTLGLPALEGALALLGSIIGRRRISAELAAAEQVVRACGLLPLAVRIAGNRLAAWPQWTLEYLVGRLADERDRLAWLKAGDLEVRSAFAISYEALSAVRKQFFQRLSLVPGADFGAELAAVVADRPVSDAEQVLDELAAASLIEPAPTPGRYRLHDLLRLYADERLRAEQDENQRQQTNRRLVGWLLDTAAAAACVVAPPGTAEAVISDAGSPDTAPAAMSGPGASGVSGAAPPVTRGAGSAGGAPPVNRPGPAEVALDADESPRAADQAVAEVVGDLPADHPTTAGAARQSRARPTQFAGDRNAALAWLDAERENVLGAARQATGAQVTMLLNSLVWYMDLRCAWTDLRRLSELAQATAPDLASAALAWNCLGLAFGGMNEYERAASCHERAAELARSAGDLAEESSAYDKLGVALWGLDRFAEAAGYHERDVQMCRMLGDRWGEAAGLNHLGYALFRQDRFAEAVECHARARDIQRELGDMRAEAMATQALGRALCGLGRYAEAAECQERALAVFGVVGDHWAVAIARQGMGIALHGLGRIPAAVDQLRHALALFESVRDRMWQAHTLRALGIALQDVGERDEARLCWQRAVDGYQGLGSGAAQEVRRLLDESARDAH